MALVLLQIKHNLNQYESLYNLVNSVWMIILCSVGLTNIRNYSDRRTAKNKKKGKKQAAEEQGKGADATADEDEDVDTNTKVGTCSRSLGFLLWVSSAFLSL